MEIPSDAQLVRIYIGESDKSGHRPLYEVIVTEARKRGMAGATVLRGMMGFGKNSRMHTTKILRLSEDLPLVIDIVDSRERVQEFLPELNAMVTNGLVTVENIQVEVYRHDKP
ncbi:MAG: DUF190 domain-containing protein [Candidatus Hydrogenedentes bacterium]|nr:DUF190 domain-containing protein [Candidatus Hydrogenedentota bacterium]